MAKPYFLLSATLLGLVCTPAPAAGPDIAIGDINGTASYGRLPDASGDIWAFMFGKTDCNLGDTPVDVFANSTHHPIVAEHLFRFSVVGEAARFEQIGMSHCWHEFLPLQGALCFSDCRPDPNNPSRLGAHCSSADSASAMGSQPSLGPRDEVNAFTGVFAYPPRPYSPATAISERLQVRDRDLLPALNPGARYVAEAHIIAPDDAAAGNGVNNASYRMVSVSGSSSSITIVPAPGSATRRELPAIRAWAELDPSVQIANVDVPGEGRFVVAWSVTQVGPCLWHYEYAIQNINSDRSGAAFVLPVLSWMSVANVGFHAPQRHSGDLASNDDWVVSRTPTMLAWSSPQDFSTNPNTNALRWGTLYNFRFDSPQAPAMADASLVLFKPGVPERVAIQVSAPRGCVADTDDGSGSGGGGGGGGGTPDCGVTIDDLLYYLDIFRAGLPRADIDDALGTGTPDGGVTIDDLLFFLVRYAEGC